MKDIMGYNKVKKAIDEGHTLSDIMATIKDKSGGTISISIDGNEYITYENMAEASEGTGIPTSTLAQHKNKANVEHSVIRLRGGKIYVIRFEGYKDINVKDTRPKKLGKSLTLLVNGDYLKTYGTLSEAASEIGTSLRSLTYHYNKSQGNDNPKTFKSNGNTYQFCTQ